MRFRSLQFVALAFSGIQIAALTWFQPGSLLAIGNDYTRLEGQEEADGNTPLHLAAKAGDFEAVSQLISQGAVVDSLNKEKKTPLMLAVAALNPNMRVIRLLISKGADVNHSDKFGNTALHIALASGGNLQVQFLLACGANPLAKNKRGHTPLQDSKAAGETQAFVAGFIKSLREPVPSVKRTKATCSRQLFQSQPDSMGKWSTVNIGRFTGPVLWSETPSGRTFLGPFGQQSVSCKLSDLPLHKNVHVELELFVLGSWDGNGDGAGPDTISVSVAGVGTLMHSSFFNNTEFERAGFPIQSYPDPYPHGFHKGYNGAAEVHSLGWIQNFPRDAVYKIEATFAHSGPDLEIVVTGMTRPQPQVTALSQDETWGIGKLTVRSD